MTGAVLSLILGVLLAPPSEVRVGDRLRTMVGALPPETNSVLCGFPAEMRRRDWPLFKEWSERLETWINGQGEDLRSFTVKKIWHAKPKIFVWGASDFEPPLQGEARGNYNERAIYYFERSTRRIRRTLTQESAEIGVNKTFKYDGAEVFEGTITDASPECRTGNAVDEFWFVAFFTNHYVLTAESRSDIEHMVRELKRFSSLTSKELFWLRYPPRFQLAGSSAWGAVTVMRRTSPNECCQTAPPTEIGVSTFSVGMGPSLSDPIKPTCTGIIIAVDSNTLEASLNWYKTKFFPESFYRWGGVREITWPPTPESWTGHTVDLSVKNEWRVPTKYDENGKKVWLTMEERDKNGTPAKMLTLWETLFGVCFTEEWLPMSQASDSKKP